MNIWKEPTEDAVPFKHYIAVRGTCYHKLMEMKATTTKGLPEGWELFHSNVTDGEFIWGMFVEGLGMIDVMVPVENHRALTFEEAKHFSNQRMQMVGSHSGKVSWEFNLPNMEEDSV